MSNAKIITTAVFAATIATAPLAIAPAMAQEATAPTAVSSSEMDAFAEAYKDVVTIEQDYRARFQDAADDAEKQAIVAEAQAKMTQAVEDAPDIEVERYVEILQIAQNDPDLQADLAARLQD